MEVCPAHPWLCVGRDGEREREWLSGQTTEIHMYKSTIVKQTSEYFCKNREKEAKFGVRQSNAPEFLDDDECMFTVTSAGRKWGNCLSQSAPKTPAPISNHPSLHLRRRTLYHTPPPLPYHFTYLLAFTSISLFLFMSFWTKQRNDVTSYVRFVTAYEKDNTVC